MVQMEHDPAVQRGQITTPAGARLDVLIGLAALAATLWPGAPGQRPLEMSWGIMRVALMAIPAGVVEAIRGLRDLADIQLGVYAGPAYTAPGNVRLHQPNGTDLIFHDVPWRGEPFRRPPYYGYRGTYWPGGRSLGLMLDFTHIKAMAIKSHVVRLTGSRDGQAVSGTEALSKTFRKLEFTHGYNLLTLNAVYRRSNPAGRFRPYVGVGAGLSIPHVEMLRAGWPKETRTNEYQLAGPAFQFLAGIQWQVSAHISFFLEYKLSCSINAGRLSGGGALETTLCSHQLLAGPSAHLSGARTVSRLKM